MDFNFHFTILLQGVEQESATDITETALNLLHTFTNMDGSHGCSGDTHVLRQKLGTDRIVSSSAFWDITTCRWLKSSDV